MVCAVNDGAEWEQQFVDDHRPDAVRILDWGHSAEHLSAVARAVWGQAPPAEQTWRAEQLRALKEDDPPPLLLELRRLRETLTTGEHDGANAEAPRAVEAQQAYFMRRQEQIRYAAFAQAGYPIGSGAVESGNKLVVEGRLKGAGMNWAPEPVDPMVALRTVACNDRGDEARLQITTRLRERTHERAASRRVARQAAKTARCPVPDLLPGRSEPAIGGAPPQAVVPPSAPRLTTDQARTEPTPPPGTSRKPAPDQPWRHQPIGKARYRDRRLLAS